MIESLEEFASESEQRRLWLASDGEVSSFEEASEGLFTDSGLSHEFDRKRPVFGFLIDGDLRLLHIHLRRIADRHQRDPPEAIIADPDMDDVRQLAGLILKRFGTLPD